MLFFLTFFWGKVNIPNGGAYINGRERGLRSGAGGYLLGGNKIVVTIVGKLSYNGNLLCKWIKKKSPVYRV